MPQCPHKDKVGSLSHTQFTCFHDNPTCALCSFSEHYLPGEDFTGKNKDIKIPACCSSLFDHTDSCHLHVQNHCEYFMTIMYKYFVKQSRIRMTEDLQVVIVRIIGLVGFPLNPSYFKHLLYRTRECAGTCGAIRGLSES